MINNQTRFSRRAALGIAAGGAALAVAGGVRAEEAAAGPSRDRVLADLERQYDTRLGVYAFNAQTRAVLRHRQDERFPIASVFKPLAAAAVLRDHDRHGEVLARRMFWTAEEVVEASPVTEKHVQDGLTVAELCHAAITQSDNTAGNLILKVIGGPRALTRFARSIGDPKTRLDRWETDLNSALPGDLRDTTTPAAIAHSYARLIIGNELAEQDSRQLMLWMLANQTSGTKFRAGVPVDWPLADKTGSPAYGGLNDVGITWNPSGHPIVIAALSVTDRPDAVIAPELLADVARIATDRLD